MMSILRRYEGGHGYLNPAAGQRKAEKKSEYLGDWLKGPGHFYRGISSLPVLQGLAKGTKGEGEEETGKRRKAQTLCHRCLAIGATDQTSQLSGPGLVLMCRLRPVYSLRLDRKNESIGCS